MCLVALFETHTVKTTRQVKQENSSNCSSAISIRQHIGGKIHATTAKQIRYSDILLYISSAQFLSSTIPVKLLLCDKLCSSYDTTNLKEEQCFRFCSARFGTRNCMLEF